MRSSFPFNLTNPGNARTDSWILNNLPVFYAIIFLGTLVHFCFFPRHVCQKCLYRCGKVEGIRFAYHRLSVFAFALLQCSSPVPTQFNPFNSSHVLPVHSTWRKNSQVFVSITMSGYCCGSDEARAAFKNKLLQLDFLFSGAHNIESALLCLYFDVFSKVVYRVDAARQGRF